MTYAEYTKISPTCCVPESSFDFYAARAEELLDKLTDGKLISAGKNACFAVAELTESIYSAGKRGAVKREDNDGYIVEYFGEFNAEKAAYAAARAWLPEEILYAGVRHYDCREH